MDAIEWNMSVSMWTIAYLGWDNLVGVDVVAHDEAFALNDALTVSTGLNHGLNEGSGGGERGLRVRIGGREEGCRRNEWEGEEKGKGRRGVGRQERVA